MSFSARIVPLLAAMAVVFGVQAQEAPSQRTEVATAARNLEAKITAWRRDFHAHPELSNREERTSAKVVEHLRALGLKPTVLARHGVVAIITGGKPGPKIALRADMDALPVTEQTGLPFASKATST